MSRVSSSSALRSLAAAAWSRGGRGQLLIVVGCELSATTTAMEGQVQRSMTKTLGGMRLLSSSSSSFLDLFRPQGRHASGSCSRCGSACRCASCCWCNSNCFNSRRGMATTTSATMSSSSTPFSHRPRHHRSVSSAASSSPPAPVVNVTVASMGESITEGTVAAVLKSPGEAVTADEVIAKIETDKVTIDVRAPFSGKIASVEVKEGESVVVGQVVAKLVEGAEGVTAAAAKPAAKPAAAAAVAAAAPPPPPAAAAAAASSSAPSPPPPRKTPQSQQQRRKPSISFPARLTKSGVRISSLSAGDAREARAAIRAAGLDGPELAERLSRGRPAGGAGGSNATIPLYVGTERGTKLSASRVLSDREMEMIELGGAAP